jgi:hypothetical protein
MLPIFSYGWYNIHKCPTGSYEYSDSLTVSHRNEEDAMAAIKGLKDTLAKETAQHQQVHAGAQEAVEGLAGGADDRFVFVVDEVGRRP